MGISEMTTRRKTHLTLITLLILAASALPIGAADPDVYMNTVASSGTCPVSPPAGAPGEVAIDQGRHAASAADADVYLRGETSTGGVIGSSADVAILLEVLADLLASLLH